MTDEITDEFTQEELEAQAAAQLPAREAMSIVSLDGADGGALLEDGLGDRPVPTDGTEESTSSGWPKEPDTL